MFSPLQTSLTGGINEKLREKYTVQRNNHDKSLPPLRSHKNGLSECLVMSQFVRDMLISYS